jgi:hypothetical protein
VRAEHKLDFDNGLHLWALCGVKTDMTIVIESKSEGFTCFSKAHCGNRTPTHKAEE